MNLRTWVPLLALLTAVPAWADSNEMSVRQTIEAFYTAFNAHDFSRIQDFTTKDWVHVNPFGGKSSGRDAVLSELAQVHGTFLKGVTDLPEQIEIRFASAEVAVATVVSRLSPVTTPDGVRHENQRQIRTFVVCLRDGRWLIFQDQNTALAGRKP